MTKIKKGNLKVNASVHDPAIFAKSQGEYYIFGTHMSAAKSSNLKDWESFANGVNKENPLFDNLFDEDKKAFSFTGKFADRHYAVWAPDVTYNPVLKKYMMYFCTTASYVKSSLCFATADNVEGPYTFQDTILHSGYNKETVNLTNIKEVLGDEADLSRYFRQNGNYENLKWPNCIDPNLFYDRDGSLWMVYGSWSGGIFLLEIDEKTGYPIYPQENKEDNIDPYYGKKIMGGGHRSIEGPYILYDKEADYYYLFVSYGGLARDGGYQIRLFRSKDVLGPYTDMKGQILKRVHKHEKYGVKLIGNYDFPSLSYAYKAPGHNSAFIDYDGRKYVVYHQRFENGKENHEPRIHQLFTTKSDWLVAAPFNTNGERLSKEGYSNEDIGGTYHIVNHGQDISSDVHKSQEKIITESDFVLEKGTCNIKLDYEGVDYEGVVIDMEDEAGNKTRCICALANNKCIWAVRYL